jgi:cytochrome c oxidase cbb3-type subunit 3
VTARAFAALIGTLLASTSCRREARSFAEPPPLRARPEHATLTPVVEPSSHFLDNAWSVSEGSRLFGWYNCAGCHALGGGGGMGPPLRDGAWRYGGSPADIHRSIVEGRPNGMPAFGPRVPDYQIWQLCAYVLSLSGRLRMDVEPGRPEAIAIGQPPAMAAEKPPTTEPLPEAP